MSGSEYHLISDEGIANAMGSSDGPLQHRIHSHRGYKRQPHAPRRHDLGNLAATWARGLAITRRAMTVVHEPRHDVHKLAMRASPVYA
jgi:hypothetical protein